MSFSELYHVVFDMSVTACIMAKSYIWRKEPLPEDLLRYVKQLYDERPPHLERPDRLDDQ